MFAHYCSQAPPYAYAVITCKIEYSQALKLRSECTPKHHDCAQIALPSNKIALRLHSKTPRLRSDCTPKQQDCAQIALSKYRNCTPTALQMTKIAIPKIVTALRAIARSAVVRHCSRKQSDCVVRHCTPL